MLTLALLAALLPASAFAATWRHAVIVDVTCSAKAQSNPKAHATSCALQCSPRGLGIFTAEGKFLKLDARGTKEATEILLHSKKRSDVEVTVTGDLHGATIAVESITAAG